MPKYEVTLSYTEIIDAKDAAAARKKLRKHVNERRVPENITAREMEQNKIPKTLIETCEEC